MTTRRQPPAARPPDLLADPLKALPLFSGTPIPYRESEHAHTPREAPPVALRLFGRLTFEELAEGNQQKKALARQKKQRAAAGEF